MDLTAMIPTRPDILVIDYDPSLQPLYRTRLGDLGNLHVYSRISEIVRDGYHGEDPALIVADVGWENDFIPKVLVQNRDMGRIFHSSPVIFVSVADDVDLIRSLVDREKRWDFISKPFSWNLLYSKCASIVAESAKAFPILNPAAMVVHYKGLSSEPLTALEMKVVCHLLRQNTFTSHMDDLASEVWGCKKIDGRLDTTLSRIRKKIAGAGLNLTRDDLSVSLVLSPKVGE